MDESTEDSRAIWEACFGRSVNDVCLLAVVSLGRSGYVVYDMNDVKPAHTLVGRPYPYD
jgi:hypothetical protein